MKTPFIAYVQSFFTTKRLSPARRRDRLYFAAWLLGAALSGYAIGFTSGYVL